MVLWVVKAELRQKNAGVRPGATGRGREISTFGGSQPLSTSARRQDQGMALASMPSLLPSRATGSLPCETGCWTRWATDLFQQGPFYVLSLGYPWEREMGRTDGEVALTESSQRPPAMPLRDLTWFFMLNKVYGIFNSTHYLAILNASSCPLFCCCCCACSHYKSHFTDRG